jgi:hypothetical protein
MLSDEVPCALYFDLDAFEATLRDVKQSFPPDTMHAIAMKANPLAACLLIAKELGFQQVEDFRPPDWPEGPVPMQMHLDFFVDDLDNSAALRRGSLGVTQ